MWLVALLLLAGVGLLAYPAVSNWVNTRRGSYVVTRLHQQLVSADEAFLQQQLQLARDYNAGRGEQPYADILDFGDGVMGVLRIPSLQLELPIYHGVSQTVLSKGVGHLPQSDFPVGGSGCHSVLTGHTGLVSARLLTDLEKLQPGDLFYVDILEQTLQYTVDQITVVLPDQEEALAPVEGEDYCTLVTCTPYGVNSHRLLVRGTRSQPTEREETAEMEPQRNFSWLWGAAAVVIIGSVLIIRCKRGA